MAKPRLPVALLPLAVTYTAVAMNLTVANVALPAISLSFPATAAELTWVVNITPLVAAALILFAGEWGDRIGPRRLLITGLAVFLVAALLSGFATDITGLIIFRALTGVGSALAMPAALATTFDVTRGPRQRTAIGIMASTQAIGAILGPIVGGAALTAFGWPAAFWSVIPMLGLALIGVATMTPKSTAPTADQRSGRTSDTVGAALAALSAVGLLYALVSLSDPADAGDRGVLGGLVVGLAALLALIGWERRTRYPLFIPGIIARRTFWLPTLALFIVQLTLGGLLFVASQYLQLVVGYSAFAAGAVLLPALLMWTVVASGSGALAERFGVPWATAGSLVLAAVGLALLAGAGESPAVPLLVVAMLFTGVLGVTPALMTHAAVRNYPENLRTTGSAINGVATRLGLAFGVAVYGTLLARTFGREFDPALADLPPALAQSARQSIGSALRTAEALAPPAATELAAAARAAFMTGFSLSLAIGAGALIVLAAAVRLLLPEIPSESEADPSDSAQEGRDEP
ncbi:MAG: MFS transporter [Actinobacteria bacterium]|nr:MFS transporter [Actinomycetota bacterium]